MALLAAAISVGAVAGGSVLRVVSRVRRQGLAVVALDPGLGSGDRLLRRGWGLAGGHAGVMLWIALAFLAVGGAADMVSAAFRTTILQEAASDDLRGRLQGVFIVVVAGGPRMADTVHGAAAAVVGTTVAATGGSVGGRRCAAGRAGGAGVPAIPAGG